MQLQFSENTRYKLLNYSPNSFVILKILGKPYLLVKASPDFSNNTIIRISFEGQHYEATFLRHVNLGYASKLSELVGHIGLGNDASIQNNWLVMFQIRCFNPIFQMSFVADEPPYGSQIVIRSSQENQQVSSISNLFKYREQAFYFVDASPQKQQRLNLITSKNRHNVYGITYVFKNIVICIPIHCILSEKNCPVKICQSVRPQLKNTCYVSYRGNYCTGFLLDEKTVISAKHLVPFEEQKIGLQVGIRLYPYNQEQTGHITRMGQGSVDFLVILLESKIISQIKTVGLQNQKMAVFDKQYECLLGNKVRSLGFGKFIYSPYLFRKIQIVMPTIESGVISKIINIGHKNVFIKTDVALFNGFSGSALWLGQAMVGMAIFILKNKYDYSSYNRHNFSYTIQFILHLISSSRRSELISQINPQLQCFDRIQTRHKINLFPKL